MDLGFFPHAIQRLAQAKNNSAALSKQKRTSSKLWQPEITTVDLDGRVLTSKVS